MNKVEILIVGSIAVKSAVENNKREVYRIVFNKDKLKHDRNLKYIDKIAQAKSISIDYLSSGKFKELNVEGSGGIIAYVGLYQYYKGNDYTDCLYLLDGIEDPYNLGHSLRSLYASGISQVILPRNIVDHQESVVLRSSAGALDKMDIIVANELDELLSKLNKADYKIIALDRKDSISLYNYDFNSKIVIVVGGEKRGISSSILKYCDERIFIPYANDFRCALTATSVVSIIAFEMLRKKGGH